MRINIQVPDTHAVASSSMLLDDIPAPLIRLAPTNELVLIELQGSLEIDDADPNGGQVLAKLEFHPGREDKPTLLVSHHRLEGKLVSLTKPMAVLEVKKRPEPALDQEQHRSTDVASSPSRFVDEQRSRVPIDDADDDAPPASPTLTRKRGRGANDDEDGTKDIPSSSPLVRPCIPGSEADFSSPLPASKRRATNPQLRNSKLSNEAVPNGEDDEIDSDNEDDAWMHKRDTVTYMEVVCIIRKKFLFSKRPEPVVRLNPDGGQAVKAALGVA